MDATRRLDSCRHTGRTAVVTGAASGIGRATAKRLAAEGAVVVACDVDEERLSSLGRGRDAIIAVVADTTVQTDVDRVIEAAAAVAPIGLLANVAGIGDGMLPAGDVDDATWERVMTVNVTGSMRFCRAVLPAMQAERQGAIVNVASVAGLSGGAGGAAYTASKHAVIGLTRSIAYLYALEGIRCNAVCPGGVLTRIDRTATAKVPWVAERMEPAMARNPGFVDADHIAALISWLGSDEAANVNGAVVTSDGGWMAA